jgi:putative membrane protein
MFNYGYGFGGMGFLGGIGMLFWFIILFALFFFLIRSFGQKKKDALEILESRYAKGEIGKKEFEEKKKGLE